MTIVLPRQPVEFSKFNISIDRKAIIAAFPFLICDAILVALLIAFPNLALFLPGMMR